MSETKLAEVVAFQNTDEYHALSDVQKISFVRNDAFAFGYAWGRLDQGHPAIAAVRENETPNTSATAWMFGGLYARMLLELDDPSHERSSAFSVQSAWDFFAETGCPEGRLPLRLS